MGITANPEVLPPRPRWSARTRAGAPGTAFDDRHLDLLSHLLDDFIRIPGTPIRFGLDGIIGFIPGIGDVVGGLASTIIILAAWVRGVPRIVLARMVANVLVETAVGSVPVLGNFFDIAWRANRRNYKLLSSSTTSAAQARHHSAISWILFAGFALVLISLMLLPPLAVAWLVLHLRASTN